jgi:hypothetical protein
VIGKLIASSCLLAVPAAASSLSAGTISSNIACYTQDTEPAFQIGLTCDVTGYYATLP